MKEGWNEGEEESIASIDFILLVDWGEFSKISLLLFQIFKLWEREKTILLWTFFLLYFAFVFIGINR